MTKHPSTSQPRGIAVVDIGFTNSKVILYDAALSVLGERKIISPHHDGAHYREIDLDPILAFARSAIIELDTVAPIDTIVTCAHGACITCLKSDGTLALAAMDYMSDPPAHVLEAYKKQMPGYAETYSPLLPKALLHAVQLFWQQTEMPEAFAQTKYILPLMQYVAFGLGGRPVTEISSIACQSHLMDLRDGGASSLAKARRWDRLFAPRAKAWEVIGTFPGGLRGEGKILAGVHDSNANFLRYLAGGHAHFTLLSTGTWIIGFDTDADMLRLDPARDIVANCSVLGKTIACSRFFGGKEFEILAQGADGNAASLNAVLKLIGQGTFAIPSFSDSGGPVPGTGGKGSIKGPKPTSPEDRASLASLYCALMVSESLDALHSHHTVIVDGPFSQNDVFLNVLASLRPRQTILASEARDGTAAGAACLALMPEGKLPNISLALRNITSVKIDALSDYQRQWQAATPA